MKQIIKLTLCLVLILSTRLTIAQENEPLNNNLLFADNPTTGSLYRMYPSNDIDYIKVDVAIGGVLQVILDSIPVNTAFYVDIKVYNSDTTTLLGSNPSSSCYNCLTSTSASILVCPGTYYIKLQENSGEGDSRYFNVRILLDSTDNYECNNSMLTASLVQVNSLFSAKLFGRSSLLVDSMNIAGSDVDYFKFYVPVAGVLNAGITNIPAQNGFYINMELYDLFSGQLIATNPGSNACWNCPGVTEFNAIIIPGWYYLKLYDDTYQTAGSLFDVSLTVDTSDFCEFNNNFIAACSAPLGNPFNIKLFGINKLTASSINTAGADVDYYKFHLSMPSSIQIILSNIPTSTYGYFILSEILGADTNNIIYSSPNSNCHNCPSSVSYTTGVLDTGYYYIRFRDNNFQTNSSLFTVTLKCPTPVITNAIQVIGGDKKICPGDTVKYKIGAVTGALQYDWELPNGAFFLGGEGTREIVVYYTQNFAANDSLKVRVANECGFSNFKARIVRRNNPIRPVSITGPASSCANQTGVPYSITPVSNAANYTWFGPSGSRLSDGTTTSTTAQLTTTSTSVQVNFKTTPGLVRVRTNNACGVSAARTLVVSFNCRELDELGSNETEGGYRLYPNPSDGWVTIESLNADTPAYLTIFNTVGQVVATIQATFSGGKERMDLSNLEEGLYFIQINNGSGLVTERLTIN